MQAQGPSGIKYIQSAAAAGTRVIRPDTWTMLSFEVTNPTDASVELLATSYFESQTSLQFGRQVWVPAHAKRRSWYPVRPPSMVGQEGNLVNVHSLLIDRTDEAETDKVLTSPTGAMHHHGLIGAKLERPATGMFEDADDDRVRKVINAARSARNLKISVFDLRQDSMPPRTELLEGLDQVVVASDQLLQDGAALTAVRRWLSDGGRVWLMLDKVSPGLLQQLVGDRVGWAPVDRVQLDAVTIEDTRPVPADQKRAQTMTYIDPVEMVRGVLDNVEVTHSVNGWPAACWCNVGRGELLMTTLESRAWYRRWNDSDAVIKDVRKRSDFAATESLQLLAERFLVKRETPVPAATAFRTFVAREIGQKIMSRSTVASVLGGLCLGLVIVSGICIRLKRTALIGWLGPLAAILFAVGLGVAGTATRNAVGRSLAVGQWIEVDAPFSEVRTSGVMAIYNPNRQVEPLGSSGGGIFLPHELETAGTSVRMVWTDTDRWQLENLTMESGLHFAPFTYATPINDAIRATATFGPDGLTGRLDSRPASEISDAILVVPHGPPLRVRPGENQSFEARSTDLLPPGQFSSSAIVSDEQRRRQDVLQSLLGEESDWRPAERLTLLAWTEPLDLPFVLNEPERRSGSALLTVPVRLLRPEPGTRVSVPSTLMSYRVVAAADGTMSSAYSNQQKKWVGEVATATQASLRIALPPEVLPIKIEQLSVQIDVRAPQRLLELVGHYGETDHVLLEKQSPVGAMDFTLTGNEYLQVDGQGGMLLTLRIGTHPHEASGSISEVGWKIDELSFEVQGVARPLK